MTPDGYKTWAPDIRVERLTALFVAKECVYKCLRPLADDFIDFADATMSALDIDSATGAGTGTVRLLREFGPAIPAGLEVTVRFAGAGALRHGLVLWPMVSAP
jgi:4'-phosphopantetheinyl transferase EntD